MAEHRRPAHRAALGHAKHLVVFLHGYGADGNDLIDIGRAWQSLLPDAAFVSPHAPRPCGQAPQGREWFPLTFRDPGERWAGVTMAAPGLNAFLDAELARLRLPPSALALVGFQPRHHDVAACGPAAAGLACGHRRLFRHAGHAGGGRPGKIRRRDRQPPAGAAGARRPGPADPGRRPVPCRAKPGGA